MNYLLSTAHDGRFYRHEIVADDDTEATFAAIAWIMDSAVLPGLAGEIWAKGEIFLIDPDGNIIHTMPAKENA